MKASRIILYLFLLTTVLPLLAIFCLSMKGTGPDVFKWYIAVFRNADYREALAMSVLTSMIVSLCSLCAAIFFSLSWFKSGQRTMMLAAIVLIGLMPPDVLALSINKMANLLGFYNSNPVFLILCLVYYCLPYNIILIWSAYYYIEEGVVVASRDIGLNKMSFLIRVIVPLISPAIVSCFVLSFLLALNEFPRTYYLSGSNQLISEFLNGKLTAGADPSIYAGGSVSVLIILIFIAGLQVYYIFKRRVGRDVQYTNELNSV